MRNKNVLFYPLLALVFNFFYFVKASKRPAVLRRIRNYILKRIRNYIERYLYSSRRTNFIIFTSYPVRSPSRKSNKFITASENE